MNNLIKIGLITAFFGLTASLITLFVVVIREEMWIAVFPLLALFGFTLGLISQSIDIYKE